MATGSSISVPGRRSAEQVAVEGDHRVAERRRVLSDFIGLTYSLNEAIDAVESPVDSNTEIMALVTIELDGPRRVQQLGKAVGLSPAGTTGLVDRLQHLGMVSRTAVPGDRRGVMIELTGDGGALVVDRIARAVRSVLRSSTPLISSWKPQFTSLGCELGPRVMPHGRRQLLEHVRSFGRAGSMMVDLYRAVFGDSDPSPMHTHQLLLLASETGATRPNWIIESTGLSSASVSDLLTRAEAAGLVVRRAGRPPDRRVVSVELTERGRAKLDELVSRSDEVLRAFAAVFFPPNESESQRFASK